MTTKKEHSLFKEVVVALIILFFIALLVWLLELIKMPISIHESLYLFSIEQLFSLAIGLLMAILFIQLIHSTIKSIVFVTIIYLFIFILMAILFGFVYINSYAYLFFISYANYFSLTMGMFITLIAFKFIRNRKDRI